MYVFMVLLVFVCRLLVFVFVVLLHVAPVRVLLIVP